MRRVSHAYNFLQAVCLTGVSLIFFRGIPWWAWVGSFLLLFLAAELWSRVLLNGSDDGEQQSGVRTLFTVAAVAAALLLLVAALYMGEVLPCGR